MFHRLPEGPGYPSSSALDVCPNAQRSRGIERHGSDSRHSEGELHTGIGRGDAEVLANGEELLPPREQVRLFERIGQAVVKPLATS